MEKVRIQDDLFNYVNQEWEEQAVIPADRPRTGAFDELAIGVEKLLIDDLNDMVKSGQYPNDYLKYACLLYSKVKDVKKRNKDGIKPLLKTLQRIEKLNTVNDLNKKLKDFVEDFLPLPFVFSVDVDMKNADNHAVFVQGPSVILPDVTSFRLKTT